MQSYVPSITTEECPQVKPSATPRAMEKADPKAGPIQMIRERTKVRQARWEQIRL
jgi:hypothetical protein